MVYTGAVEGVLALNPFYFLKGFYVIRGVNLLYLFQLKKLNMRLRAEFYVLNRSLFSGIRFKSIRSMPGLLTIGRKPNIKNDPKQNIQQDLNIYLMVSTAQDLAGRTYQLTRTTQKRSIHKITPDVEIFAQNANEGKATLRFLEPIHDIVLKRADPIHLKAFLNLMKGLMK